MTDSANAVACVADSDQAVSGHQSRIHAAWLIVPCLTADGLMVLALVLLRGPPDEVSMAIVFGIMGCVLAQGNLLAAWLAWSDGPFLRRLLTHWKIAAGLYFVWFLGLGLVTGGADEALQIAAVVALVVPLVSLAAQFPLWLARQWLGWRLVRGNADPAHREPPLAIRDLMVATLVVAASLALARLAPSPDGKTLWPVWGVAVLVASVISSIALLPAGALLLRSRLLSRGLYWSGLYAAAWIAMPWIIVAVVRLFGLGRLPPWQIFVGLSSLMLTFAATLMLTAVIARDRGYRLTSRRLSIGER